MSRIGFVFELPNEPKEAKAELKVKVPEVPEYLKKEYKKVVDREGQSVEEGEGLMVTEQAPSVEKIYSDESLLVCLLFFLHGPVL